MNIPYIYIFRFEDFESSAFLSLTFLVWTSPCSLICIDKRNDQEWYNVCPLYKWFTQGLKCWPSSVLTSVSHMTNINVFDFFFTFYLKKKSSGALIRSKKRLIELQLVWTGQKSAILKKEIWSNVKIIFELQIFFINKVLALRLGFCGLRTIFMRVRWGYHP